MRKGKLTEMAMDGRLHLMGTKLELLDAALERGDEATVIEEVSWLDEQLDEVFGDEDEEDGTGDHTPIPARE